MLHRMLQKLDESVHFDAVDAHCDKMNGFVKLLKHTM